MHLAGDRRNTFLKGSTLNNRQTRSGNFRNAPAFLPRYQHTIPMLMNNSRQFPAGFLPLYEKVKF